MEPDEQRHGANEPERILHITSKPWWHEQQAAGNRFRDPSLDTEGFIHCSTFDQFLIPANERFAGRRDLILLVIDIERLDADLVYEDCYESGVAFPHVYGEIPMAAVVAVVDFPPGDEGLFTEPHGLASARLAEAPARSHD